MARKNLAVMTDNDLHSLMNVIDREYRKAQGRFNKITSEIDAVQSARNRRESNGRIARGQQRMARGLYDAEFAAQRKLADWESEANRVLAQLRLRHNDSIGAYAKL